ncbi:MAG: GNAT family N-acetyltransferase [Sphingomonadaceae bacterium]|jgi:L-amino acid N-acyltransferase YncA|nr:GNAT family N-acetyltransferase [Sphingomonadaceae bacterium]
MRIRPVDPADAAEIAAIYAHHVLHGTASYETVPPDAAEIGQRMARVLSHSWPWLVAEDEAGALLGYAYATQFRDRAAYRYVCEDSIYIRDDARGQGVGKALLGALIAACEEAGFRQMVAVIGGAEPASAALHARLGFAEAGRLSGIGRKQGRWLDTLYMQRSLGPGSTAAPEVEPV